MREVAERLPRAACAAPTPDREHPVADLAFLALTLSCFALLVALVRGVERL
jgi:hypothetical protein